jgi:DNA-binding PadR family transcriptional regulator
MARVRLYAYQFYILLALAVEPLSGAGIQKRIIGDTVGRYVRDSSLYDALSVLAEAGLLERLANKTYRLTAKGRRRLEVEARAMVRATRLAQERLGQRYV